MHWDLREGPEKISVTSKILAYVIHLKYRGGLVRSLQVLSRLRGFSWEKLEVGLAPSEKGIWQEG